MRSFTPRDGMLWCGVLIALPLALLLRNPMLLPLRWASRPLVLAAALGAVWVIISRWRHPKPWQRQHTVLIVLWLVALVSAVAQEGLFQWRRHQVLHTDSTDLQRLGSHIIIGYSRPEESRMLVQRGLVGGIFVAANTVQGKTTQAIGAEIAALQSLRKKAGLPPLVVSTDQEGGIVARMSPPLASTPALATVIAGAKQKDIEPLAFTYGQEHGRGLAALGINVNFAPLADLSFAHTRSPLDFHSLIGQRAIDTDPQRVSAAVIGYARGLESQGVQATLKHFPGLGRVSSDTHLFRANLPLGEAVLEKSDWIPFRQGLQATQSLLMVGHATLGAVDASRPASLSRKVVQGIVRDRWHHEGLLVTDDMGMAPVVRHGICEAGVEAINAGMDLLLVSYDTDQYYTIMYCLLQARRDGRLHDAALRASEQRLWAARATWH